MVPFLAKKPLGKRFPSGLLILLTNMDVLSGFNEISEDA